MSVSLRPNRDMIIFLLKPLDVMNEENRILHGKPCTGPNGESRLSSTAVLEIPDLEHAADVFALCRGSLNRLSYGFLASYKPSESAVDA